MRLLLCSRAVGWAWRRQQILQRCRGHGVLGIVGLHPDVYALNLDMAAVGGEDRPVLLRNARVWQWEDDGIDAAGAGTGTAMAGRADAAGAGKGWRGAFTSPRGWLRLTRAGTIAAVGDGATDAAEGERVVDLDGAYVLPGLIDAHCHVRMTGEARLEVPLGGCAGLEELQRRVNDFCARERADAADDKPGVVGSGWDQDSLGCTPTVR